VDLYDQFWEVKRRACSSRRNGIDQWLETVELLVDEMSARQALAVPHSILDPFAAQIAAMESEAVVTTLERRTGFVHETFFDYSWSRRFVARASELGDLLTSSEQDLFRRSQVRQLLTYERSSDPTKYLVDLAWLLTSHDVRLHIKVLVISLIASISGPTDGEWTVVRPLVTGDQSLLADHFWGGVRSSEGWFDTLDRAGAWQLWMSSGDAAIRSRTIWLMAGLNSVRSTEVAHLLISSRVGSTDPTELLNLFIYANSALAPQLVDLLQSHVTNGSLDDHLPGAWSAMLDVARAQPRLAPRLAAAVLERVHKQPGDEPLTASGIGKQHESAIAGLGVAAPAQYIQDLLPAILDFATGAAQPEWRTDGLVADRIWHVRHINAHYGVDDNLLLGAQRAIESLAQTDPVLAGEAIRMLQESNLEVAAFLCAFGYLGNPDQFADEAAEWLITVPGALSVGYSDSPAWLTRQVIAAISPLLDPSVQQRLEAAVRGYTTEWERTFNGLKSRGYTELTLLNGFGDNLSDASRRRRDELRRKFRLEDISPPLGIRGGWVPAPIPAERATLMTDRQWIRAMRRYASQGTEFRNGILVGGGYTQAQVLDELAGQDPARFGQLYLQLDKSVAPVYRDAILRGLSKSEVPSELFGAVLEHTADSGDPSLHRSLVRLIESQGRFDVPPVAFSLLAMIAEVDPDPAADTWDESENGDSGAFGGIEASSLNSTRGAVALAIGPLVNNDPLRLPELAATIDCLVQDRTQQVRSAMARSLAAVLFVDADAATAWFEALLEGATDGLLGSSDVEIFIHYALRLGHRDAVMPVLSRQMGSASVRARRHRARQLTVGSMGDENLDQLVDSCMAGTLDERTGVLDVAIQNLKSELRRTRLVDLVLRGFGDPEEAVRECAARAFYEVEYLSAEEGASLFDGAAAGQDFDSVGKAALIALEDYRKPLPESALRLCEQFLEAHADEMGNITPSAAATAMHAVRVAIRFHAQRSDPSLRARCLDVIDVLVANRAHGIDEELGAIDR
jgi:hypothetical protein